MLADPAAKAAVEMDEIIVRGRASAKKRLVGPASEGLVGDADFRISF